MPGGTIFAVAVEANASRLSMTEAALNCAYSHCQATCRNVGQSSPSKWHLVERQQNSASMCPKTWVRSFLLFFAVRLSCVKKEKNLSCPRQISTIWVYGSLLKTAYFCIPYIFTFTPSPLFQTIPPQRIVGPSVLCFDSVMYDEPDPFCFAFPHFLFHRHSHL